MPPRISVLFSFSLVLTAALWLSGCGAPADAPQASPGNTTTDVDHDHDHHNGHDHAHHHHDGETDAENVEQTLAQLSPEDRALAEEQEICPVSEHLLGSMGKPIKVEVEDQEVFVCCRACVKPLQDDPEQYLARLNQ